MPLTDAAKHRALNHLAGNAATGGPITHASLHNGYPSTTGANELTGGSPAYARKAITFEAVAGTELAGSLDVTSSPSFDVPAGTTVSWIGYWTALTAGTFMGWSPAGAGAFKPFSVDDIATEQLDSKAHGFANGETVVVWIPPGGVLPTPLVEGTIYFVISSATDSLQLSATSGGAAINITAVGAGLLQKIVTETYGGQGNYLLGDTDIGFS